jgi:hypothetical protein
MADTSYQPAVYRKQGGDELVVASSGYVTVESGGEITVNSGGKINLESGSTLTLAGVVGVGAAITCGSGGYVANYVQTADTTAVTILPYGLSLVTGTTVFPTFQMSNPVPGVQKWLSLVGTTADEIKAVITSATTAITFDSSGQNAITLESTGLHSVSLIGATTLSWRVMGVFYAADVALTTA